MEVLSDLVEVFSELFSDLSKVFSELFSLLEPEVWPSDLWDFLRSAKKFFRSCFFCLVSLSSIILSITLLI